MYKKTIIQLLQYGEMMLADKFPSSQLDTQVLLRAATGFAPYILLTEPNKEVDLESEKLYKNYINQRKNYKPVQYILNSVEFMSMPFFVNEHVLIPRSDTEVLVEKAIEIIHEKRYTYALEVGTGSGCISIAIGKYLANIQITSTDIDKKALTIAEANAKKNGVCNVKFLQSDLFVNIQQNYDIVISNPPYIETREIERLCPNVKDYEPHLALDGGEDGLDFYRAICKTVPHFLHSGGAIVLEIGHTQDYQVSELLKENGFIDIELTRDLAGQARVLSAIHIKKE